MCIKSKTKLFIISFNGSHLPFYPVSCLTLACIHYLSFINSENWLNHADSILRFTALLTSCTIDCILIRFATLLLLRVLSFFAGRNKNRSIRVIEERNSKLSPKESLSHSRRRVQEREIIFSADIPQSREQTQTK